MDKKIYSGKINKNIFIQILLFSVLVCIDQITKQWAVNSLHNMDLSVIKNIISFHYLENQGAAFGMLNKHPWIFIIISIIIFLAVSAVYYLVNRGLKNYCCQNEDKIKQKTVNNTIFLNYILAVLGAGAVGNLIDRVFRGFVVDYLHATFIDFPVFNLADCCITIGAGLLILYVILSEIKEQKAKKLGGDEDAVE